MRCQIRWMLFRQHRVIAIANFRLMSSIKLAIGNLYGDDGSDVEIHAVLKRMRTQT